MLLLLLQVIQFLLMLLVERNQVIIAAGLLLLVLQRHHAKCVSECNVVGLFVDVATLLARVADEVTLRRERKIRERDVRDWKIQERFILELRVAYWWGRRQQWIRYIHSSCTVADKGWSNFLAGMQGHPFESAVVLAMGRRENFAFRKDNILSIACSITSFAHLSLFEIFDLWETLRHDDFM